MAWFQKQVELAPRSRGFHLVTEDVEAKLADELGQLRIGLLHLFLQHTSASLSINENADSDVPRDLESAFGRIAPEDAPYRHTCEGPDDMPAHVKSSVLGCSLTVPIRDGRLCLGTWQGLYLCEHRNRGGRRRIVATLWGE
jgi:secondary thiamine-phosphate synthase enzyme